MPVQINELVIRANVVEGDQKQPEAAPAGKDNNSNDQNEIVHQCVAMVMEILNNKNER